MNGAPARARALACFPFIVVRSENEIAPWLVNHELIHFRQQIELLFVGTLILHILETMYARLVLKKSAFDSYTWSSNEQEAYRNQHDSEYLGTRKRWAQFHYLKNKREFMVGGPGEVVYKN